MLTAPQNNSMGLGTGYWFEFEVEQHGAMRLMMTPVPFVASGGERTTRAQRLYILDEGLLDFQMKQFGVASDKML